MHGKFTDDSDVDIAIGRDLDEIGARHGVSRTYHYTGFGFPDEETDAEFRKRIKEAMPPPLTAEQRAANS
jgi:hypothetical protein